MKRGVERRQAAADDVIALIDAVERGEVVDPETFLAQRRKKRGEEAVKASEEAGDMAEADFQEVLQGLLTRGLIQGYARTEKWGIFDLLGIDFVVKLPPGSKVGTVYVDVKSRPGLVRQAREELLAHLQRIKPWLKKAKPEIQEEWIDRTLFSERKLLLGTGDIDLMEREFLHQLSQMEEYWSKTI